MRVRRPLGLLLVALLSLSVCPLGYLATGGRAKGPRAGAAVSADERRLRAALDAGNDAPVLDFLCRRTLDDLERERAEKWVARLGDDAFAAREKAAAELAAFGPAAAGLLRAALEHEDVEVARRARRCRELCLDGADPSLPAAAARALGQRKPPRAAEVLLAYLPFAPHDEADEAARAALAALAVRDGAPDEAVLRALEGADPVRRAAAAEALVAAGAGDARSAVRALLHDPDADVRFRVAAALLRARDRDAVPALIALLPELSRSRLERAEEWLCRLAAEHAPGMAPGTTEAERRAHGLAWAEWWRAHGAEADLAHFEPEAPALGLTLVVQLGAQGAGSVAEIDRDGRPRWRLDGLDYPLDAQPLPGGRVLVAQYSARRVTERTLRGEVVWQHHAGGQVVAAQRLADGTTFIACRDRLLEVTRDGKEVFRHERGVREIAAARRLLDGTFVLLTQDGDCVRLDATGKEVRRFAVGAPQVVGVGIDVSPARRVLIPQFSEDRVAEFDAVGRMVWHAAVRKPTCAARVHGGNVLVGSSVTGEVVELDRAGDVVWTYRGDAGPVRVWRR